LALRFKYIFFITLLLAAGSAFAQSTVPNGTGAANSKKDTSKTNTNKWKNENARVSYEKLNSDQTYYPDTSLHNFQRPRFEVPWYQDMGNLGSPANNLMFSPEDRVGPSSGYHVFDIYRFNIDSLGYYNTNRAYSDFTYQLGSKLEQEAGIFHTQNIKPNWNFAIEYRKTNSPGFYKTERNNHDNAGFTTNYKSNDQHYNLCIAMVYNKEQHDENGGIDSVAELLDPAYNDRKTVDAAYQNDAYSLTRSAVSNVQRDFTFLLQHKYSWGLVDTTYNSDSTQFTAKLTPRFGITHRMEVSTEKHTYTDLTPDSLRYTTLFNQSFVNSGYYVPGGDSVLVQQKWVRIDNQVMLNGYLGKEGHQSTFSVGIGSRYDEFISANVPVPIHDSLPKLVFAPGLDRTSMVSNYVTGEIKKEALKPGEWAYGVNAKFLFSGPDAGNFMLNALIGKELNNNAGSFVAGFKEQLGTAPYSYTTYENIYTRNSYSFDPESVTCLYGTIDAAKLRLSAGIRNYVVDNYIYINELEVPDQYNKAFNLMQGWVRKVFKVGNFYLDNQMVYQQVPDNAPVNVPALMGKHQLSYERSLFGRKMKIATGIEVRYNTAYHPAGYDALLNKFFYQRSVYVGNPAEAAVFLNFRVKRFRAFLMGDNLQEIFFRNTVIYTGTPVLNYDGQGNNFTPVYAAPDALIRFGFSWALIN
jgi:Putative porin